MNRVGQLGRQGIKGPVESNEKRILRNTKTAQPKNHKVR